MPLLRIEYPFCCVHHNRDCQRFSMDQTTLKIAHSCGGSPPHLILLPWSHVSHPVNGISIGSDVFAELTNAMWPNKPNS